MLRLISQGFVPDGPRQYPGFEWRYTKAALSRQKTASMAQLAAAPAPALPAPFRRYPPGLPANPRRYADGCGVCCNCLAQPRRRPCYDPAFAGISAAVSAGVAAAKAPAPAANASTAAAKAAAGRRGSEQAAQPMRFSRAAKKQCIDRNRMIMSGNGAEWERHLAEANAAAAAEAAAAAAAAAGVERGKCKPRAPPARAGFTPVYPFAAGPEGEAAQAEEERMLREVLDARIKQEVRLTAHLLR